MANILFGSLGLLYEAIPKKTFQKINENLRNQIVTYWPLISNHVLMASDAPKEMEFTVKMGSKMYILLEIESREKTPRLFKGLSDDGNITILLYDMFWGAFFGNLTDKFGINWMFSYTVKD